MAQGPQLSLRINTSLRQELRLAPQIIQSIEILQLGTLDLAGLIKMELEENPALEIEKPARLEETGLVDNREDASGNETRVGENSDDFERLSAFEADDRWRDSLYDGPTRTKFTGEDKKHEALQNTAARSISLQDHLFEQFNLLELTELQKDIGEQVIYNIDSNGYLRYHLENIVDDLPRNLEVPGVDPPNDDPDDAFEDDDGMGRFSDSPTGDDDDDDAGDDDDDLSAEELDWIANAPTERVGDDADLASLGGRTGSDRGDNGRVPDAVAANDDDVEVPEVVAFEGSDTGDNGDGTGSNASDDGESDSGRGKKPFVSTPSGRYRRRRRKDVPELREVVPMKAPEPQPLRHARDDYFEVLYAEAEEVLAIIRTLDPPGVGAYDLVDCLELQLTPDKPHFELVAKLVRHHLEDLQKNRLPKVAKATGHSIDDIKEALTTLHLLDPRPGSIYGLEDTAYVVPDVVVREVDDQYEVIVEDQYIPDLRVSRDFVNIASSKGAGKDAKDFANKRITSARQLQLAIEERRNTLQAVAQAIVDYQKGFFEKGVTGLVPLKMQDVATTVGCHVSTVSRAVSDKYMETPRGIYPMKYFFRGGTQTSDGGEESTEVVRERVQQLVDNEPGDAPLSDDAIADMLSKEFGLAVARRTVTKYRKQLGILNSRQRRQY